MRVNLCLLTFVLSVTAGATSGQVVTSVRLVPVTAKGPAATLILQNLRGSALAEWTVELTAEPHGRTLLTSHSTVRVPPGDSTVDNLSFAPARATHARVVLAVFADGSVEGTAERLGQWQDEQRAYREELAHWIPILRLPEGSSEEVRGLLRAAVADRAARTPEDPSGVRARVRSVYAAAIPETGLRGHVENTLRELRGMHDSLAPRGTAYRPLGPGETIDLVNATVQPGGRTSAEFRLENLSGKRLEAYQVRAGGCGSGADRGGLPHEGMEPAQLFERVTLGCSDDAPPRVKFVMFDDLTYEGPARIRDDFLRERQHRAEDLARTIAVLRKAAEQRFDRLVPFLEAERGALASAAEASGRHFWTSEMNEYIKQARQSPAEFAARIPVLIERHESSRRALLRHLER